MTSREVRSAERPRDDEPLTVSVGGSLRGPASWVGGCSIYLWKIPTQEENVWMPV